MKTAIVSISYDGIISYYCGVGSITINLSKAIDNINKKYCLNLDYYMISSASNKSCLGYSEKLKKNNYLLVKRNNGKIFYLKSYNSRSNQYGSILDWKHNSKQIIDILMDLSKKYDKLIVFLHDTPFSKVGKLSLKKGIKNAIFIWIPHGTGFLHGKNSYERKKRIKWEKESIIDKKSFFIAYISDYMRRHLINNYKIKKSRLLKLTNGLILNDYKFSSNSKLLKKIPKNKKIVLCFGRSEPYKNIHSVLSAGKYLDEDIFLLIIASDNTSDNPQNLILKKESKKLNKCFLIPYHVDQEEIKNLIHNKEVLVVVPSLKEPFGMIPSEVRLWGKDSNSLVLVSKYGGLKEQVSDNIDGFIIKSFKAKLLAKQINRICNLPKNIKKNIAYNGYQRLRSENDYEKNLFNLLMRFFDI